MSGFVNEEGLPILNTPAEGERRTLDVLVVSHDQAPVTFAYDLANMMAYTTLGLPEGIDLGLHLMKGTYVHSARQKLLGAMKENGSSYVLWLDSDMRFPRDTFIRLINHRVPMVGINYSTRGVPPSYVAIKKIGLEADEQSERLATTSQSTGLEEVEAVGFGACLIRGDVLASLPPVDERPWFEMTWRKDKLQWIGEDVAFCSLVRELGHRIFVDHDLSKECAHTGQWEYKLDHLEDLPEELEG